MLEELINNSLFVLTCNNNSGKCNNISNLSLYYFNSKSITYKLPFGVLMSIISITAILGNALVIVAIIRDKTLRTVSNVFILSLSISDFMVGFFVMPLSGTIIIYDKWLWGSLICRCWLSIDYIASTASIFNLFTLSLERYFSITYPLKFITYQSKSKAKLTILLVWLISSLWILPINLWSLLDSKKKFRSFTNIFINIELDKCTTDFETDKIFKIITTLFNFYIPCLGIIVIYSKIFITITRRSKSEIGRFSCKSKHRSLAIESAIKKPNSKSISGSNLYDSYDNSINFNDSSPRSKRYSNNDGSISINSLNVNNSNTTNQLNSQEYYTQKCSLQVNNIEMKKIDNMENSHAQDGKLSALNKINSNKRKLLNSFSRASKTEYLKSKRRNALIESFPKKTETHYIITEDREWIDEANESNVQLEKSSFILFILNKICLNNIRKKPKHQRMLSPRLKQQIKAAKQLGILLLAFLITWMPYFVTFIVVAFCSQCISDNVSTLTVWLGYLNSAINPILYPLCNSSFRHAFRKMLRINPKSSSKNIIVLMNKNYK